jgi:hypothetical protein
MSFHHQQQETTEVAAPARLARWDPASESEKKKKRIVEDFYRLKPRRSSESVDLL